MKRGYGRQHGSFTLQGGGFETKIVKGRGRMRKVSYVISLYVLMTILASGCSSSKPISNMVRGNELEQSTTEPSPSLLSQTLSIAAANDHSIAVDNQGDLWIWGEVYKGLSTPQPKKFVGIKDVKSTAGDWGYTLALKKDGTVWGWGNNRDGQLGDGTHISRKNPVQVHGLENIEAISTFLR